MNVFQSGRAGPSDAHCVWLAAACAVLFLLGGCASEPEKPRSTEPPVNLSGYSPAFKKGFKDGCSTAQGKLRRDEKRFGAETQYAQGWEDGRAICSRR